MPYRVGAITQENTRPVTLVQLAVEGSDIDTTEAAPLDTGPVSTAGGSLPLQYYPRKVVWPAEATPRHTCSAYQVRTVRGNNIKKGIRRSVGGAITVSNRLSVGLEHIW